MFPAIWPAIRRVVLMVPLLAGTATVMPATACSDSTSPDSGGPHCKKGCPCGKACIDCSYTCHHDAPYALTGIVPDSLLPR